MQVFYTKIHLSYILLLLGRYAFSRVNEKLDKKIFTTDAILKFRIVPKLQICLILLVQLFSITVSAQKIIGINMIDEITETSHYVIVANVLPKSPADRAGLAKGDTIWSFNNVEIKSSYVLFDLVQAVADTSPIPVVVGRREGLKTLFVKVAAPPKITLRIRRNKGEAYENQDYRIFVNNIPVGDIACKTTQDFQIAKPFNQQGNIYVTRLLNWGDMLIPLNGSDTVPFIIRDGYIPVAEFAPDTARFPIRITYEPTDEQLTTLKKEKLNKKEADNYRHLTCDSSLAPRFFKMSVLVSLEGRVPDTIRDTFISTLLQCRAAYRLLILSLLVYVLCGCVNRNVFPFGFFALLLIYPVSWAIAWLINAIFYDGPRYIPYEFIFFIVQALLIIAGIGFAIKPLTHLLTHKTETWKKLLGWFGAALTAYEFVKTIIELFGEIKSHW